MKEVFEIGSSPWAEDCAQVGVENYSVRARAECRAFINQIRRLHGDEPDGAALSVKSFPHDFGSYYEVVVAFLVDDEAACAYADKVGGNTPEKWDDAAREELRASGHPVAFDY